MLPCEGSKGMMGVSAFLLMPVRQKCMHISKHFNQCILNVWAGDMTVSVWSSRRGCDGFVSLSPAVRRLFNFLLCSVCMCTGDDVTAGPLLRNKEFGPESVFREKEDIVWIDSRTGCVKCKNRSIKQQCHFQKMLVKEWYFWKCCQPHNAKLLLSLMF